MPAMSPPPTLKIKKVSSKIYEDDAQHINEAIGKPEYLKLAVLMYHFCQRIDPLVVLYAEVHYILTWKNPLLTIGTGLLLSTIILNLKMALFIGAASLFLSRNLLFKKLSKL